MPIPWPLRSRQVLQTIFPEEEEEEEQEAKKYETHTYDPSGGHCHRNGKRDTDTHPNQNHKPGFLGSRCLGTLNWTRISHPIVSQVHSTKT